MRFVVWNGTDAWNAEAASVSIEGGGLRATGVQLGAAPVPYRLDYRLDAARNFVTTELELTAAGEGWQRRLLLSHDGSGNWDAEAHQEGGVPAGAGGAPADLPEAPLGDRPPSSGGTPMLDCDLQNSPLTNTMPVLRHALDRGGSEDFLMAWVSVPDLRVYASRQRYEHVRRGDDGSVVRFRSLDGEFTADLELDSDGLVDVYPGLARRVDAGL